MDRSELVQLLPRQLAVQNFMSILTELSLPMACDDFSEEQARLVVEAAERYALPGLAHLRQTLKEVQALYAKHNVPEYLLVRNVPVPNTNEILHAEVSHTGVTIALFEVLPLSSSYGKDISYKLQHYDTLQLRHARRFAGGFVAQANMEIVNREGTAQTVYTLEDLINELPRSVKLGEMLSVIKAERKFSLDRLKELVDHITTISGY